MLETLSIKMEKINSKLDELQKDMDEIKNLINEIKFDSPKKQQKSKRHIHQQNKIILLDDKAQWKKEIYKQIATLIHIDNSFKRKANVLQYIYNYMRKNYGIIWEQDAIEYKYRYDLDYKPKTIDIVYDNAMYKSIFSAVLTDMIANLQGKKNCKSTDLIEM